MLGLDVMARGVEASLAGERVGYASDGDQRAGSNASLPGDYDPFVYLREVSWVVLSTNRCSRSRDSDRFAAGCNLLITKRRPHGPLTIMLSSKMDVTSTSCPASQPRPFHRESGCPHASRHHPLHGILANSSDHKM